MTEVQIVHKDSMVDFFLRLALLAEKEGKPEEMKSFLAQAEYWERESLSENRAK